MGEPEASPFSLSFKARQRHVLGFFGSMTNSSNARKAIGRLLALLGDSQHPYKPSLQIFLDLNVGKLATDMRLTELGTERGSADRPPTNATTYDDVEHRIVERLESHKQDAHGLFQQHLETYDDRTAALDFEGRFSVIQQAAPQAVGEFTAEAALGRDELYALRRRLYESEKERDDFRKSQRLNRPAYQSSTGKHTLKVGILTILFVLEVAINGGFLARSSTEGYLGGLIQAVSFAALNILASFLWGLVPLRLIVRRNPFLKLGGVGSLAIYIAFSLALNLALAHLREMPPSFEGGMGVEVLTTMLSAPFALKDVNSWVFFGIGLLFSVVALADGFMFFDPYIGYAGLDKRWNTASKAYTDTKARLIDNLKDIRDEASDAMNGAARDLSVRRSEFISLVEARRRLLDRFLAHQKQIERACQSLLAIYREANQRVRSTSPPDYFSAPHSMDIKEPSLTISSSIGGDRLERNIEESQSLLKDEVLAIHKAFDEAVHSYSEIDRMIPEKLS